MFTKICTKVSIYGNVIRGVPYWVTDKKVVTNSNTYLPNTFDIIQLHTPYDLNKCLRWK